MSTAKDDRCPHCGYCPHCGRANPLPMQPIVVGPVWIPTPSYYWWNPPVIPTTSIGPATCDTTVTTTYTLGAYTLGANN